MPSNPYVFFDETYSYRMQDTGALLEDPNTYLADIIALFLKKQVQGEGCWARV